MCPDQEEGAGTQALCGRVDRAQISVCLHEFHLQGPATLPYDCPMGRSKEISGSRLTHKQNRKEVTESRSPKKEIAADLYGSKLTHIQRNRKVSGSASSGKRDTNEPTGSGVTPKKRTVRGISRPVTFEQLADTFFNEQQKRLSPASLIRLQSMLKRLIAFFGASTKITSISEDHVRNFLRQRRRETSPGTLRLELGALKGAFRTAIEKRAVTTDPARKVVVPAEQVKTHYLTQDDFLKVLHFSPRFLRPIAMLCMGSGLTRQEALLLRWMDVDEVKRVIRVPKSQSRASRQIPLSDMARGALQMARSSSSRPTGRVFSGPSVNSENVSLAFLRACRRANAPHVSFKDLRHSFAMCLVQQGVSIAEISVYLGHSSAQAAARYFRGNRSLVEAAKALDLAFSRTAPLASLPPLRAK